MLPIFLSVGIPGLVLCDTKWIIPNNKMAQLQQNVANCIHFLLCFQNFYYIYPIVLPSKWRAFFKFKFQLLFYSCHCPLLRHHNGRDGVSNHQPHDCLLNRLFRRRSKKTSKLRVTGLCVGNSPHTWPVTRKMFPFNDVIMSWWLQHRGIFHRASWRWDTIKVREIWIICQAENDA